MHGEVNQKLPMSIRDKLGQIAEVTVQTNEENRHKMKIRELRRKAFRVFYLRFMRETTSKDHKENIDRNTDEENKEIEIEQFNVFKRQNQSYL